MEKVSKASRWDPSRISVDLPGPVPNLLLQFLLRLEMCWKHLNVNLKKGQAVSSIPQSLHLKCCRFLVPQVCFTSWKEVQAIGTRFDEEFEETSLKT